MDSFYPVILSELAILAIGAFLFWLLVARPTSKEKKQRKRPFTKSLLNNPGESSFKKLEELNEAFSDRFLELAVLVAGIIGFILGFVLKHEGNPTELPNS